MSEELYNVRIDYQALLADGRAVSLNQYGEVVAIDAEAALLDALTTFRDEREKQPHIVAVWGLRVNVELVSDTARQALAELLRNSPEPSDRFTGHTDKNGTPIHGGDQITDGKSVFVVRWDAKQGKWFLERLSGAYRYPTIHQIEAMAKVTKPVNG